MGLLQGLMPGLLSAVYGLQRVCSHAGVFSTRPYSHSQFCSTGVCSAGAVLSFARVASAVSALWALGSCNRVGGGGEAALLSIGPALFHSGQNIRSIRNMHYAEYGTWAAGMTRPRRGHRHRTGRGGHRRSRSQRGIEFVSTNDASEPRFATAEIRLQVQTETRPRGQDDGHKRRVRARRR